MGVGLGFYMMHKNLDESKRVRRILSCFCLSILVMLTLSGCKEDDNEDIGQEVSPQNISEKISSFVGPNKIEGVLVGEKAAYGISENIVGNQNNYVFFLINYVREIRTESVSLEDGTALEAFRILYLDIKRWMGSNNQVDREIVSESKACFVPGYGEVDCSYLQPNIESVRAEDLQLSANLHFEKKILKVMGINQSESMKDSVPSSRYYNLKVTNKKIDPPAMVKQKPNCLGIPSCKLEAQEYELDVLKSSGKKEKLRIIVSKSTPWLGSTVKQCSTFTTQIPDPKGGSRSIPVTQCSELVDFDFQETDTQAQ